MRDYKVNVFKLPSVVKSLKYANGNIYTSYENDMWTSIVKHRNGDNNDNATQEAHTC